MMTSVRFVKICMLLGGIAAFLIPNERPVFLYCMPFLKCLSFRCVEFSGPEWLCHSMSPSHEGSEKKR
jgi:hypothetical protein